MPEKLNPVYKLLTTEVPVNIKTESKETFHSVKKALSDARQIELKQANPEKQPVLMADAIFRSSS